MMSFLIIDVGCCLYSRNYHLIVISVILVAKSSFGSLWEFINLLSPYKLMHFLWYDSVTHYSLKLDIKVGNYASTLVHMHTSTARITPCSQQRLCSVDLISANERYYVAYQITLPPIRSKENYTSLQ